MNAIQVSLGRPIVRVETGDFDEMEKVSEKESTTGHFRVFRRVRERASPKLTRLSFPSDYQNRSQSLESFLYIPKYPKCPTFFLRDEREDGTEREKESGGKEGSRRAPRATVGGRPPLFPQSISSTSPLKICLFLYIIISSRVSSLSSEEEKNFQVRENASSRARARKEADQARTRSVNE